MQDITRLWPAEVATNPVPEYCSWSHATSNWVLDFHGNPCTAQLTVLSDGNHHMALEAALQLFFSHYPQVDDIFYSTTPPRLLKQLVESGGIQLGNLRMAVSPHVVLSPESVLNDLQSKGYVSHIKPFMRNQGSVLLVKRGNPLNIQGVADLFRNDVKLFISNPHNEAVSFHGYRNTLVAIAKSQGFDDQTLARKLDNGDDSVLYGHQIHHREALHALYNNECNVCVVYYHLALRYTRILPGEFIIVPLGGATDNLQPYPENGVSTIYAGLIAQGGRWGKKLYDYLSTDEVTDIYAYHGLVKA